MYGYIYAFRLIERYLYKKHVKIHALMFYTPIYLCVCQCVFSVCMSLCFFRVHPHTTLLIRLLSTRMKHIFG